MTSVLGRIDRYQRAHPWAAIAYATVKKFGDDAAGNLAALIAYYGFFSLFPLLLLLTTVLGSLLAGRPELQRDVLDSALTQFPVIGDQLRENVGSLDGGGVALGVGIAGALWAGMGVMKAAGNAMDEVWEVPKRERPRFLRAVLRAALMLVVLGGAVVLTAVLSGIGGSSAALPVRVVGLALAGALNVATFLLAFRVLTVRDVAWRDLLPGAVLAGVVSLGLQAVGAWFVGNRLEGASETYGVFAVVIGLLSWLYLQAQVTLLAAELNTVRAKRLWPRSLGGDDLTPADRRALREYAEVEERHDDQEVAVHFDDPSGARPADADGARGAARKRR